MRVKWMAIYDDVNEPEEDEAHHQPNFLEEERQ
jgi:hypothetical protein